jgi:[acyl-carrier-protein] S-malonyltransferase
MLADLAGQHAEVGQTFDEASEVLGYSLWDMVSKGPEESLNKTEITQPAMLAADIATWRVWLKMGGPQPGCMAGHSLGEYAALVAANALDFAVAVRLVAQRGKLMQEATPQGIGAMAAIIGLDDAAVEQACEESAAGQNVSCANFNAPGQVVIAGHAQAVARACEAAKQAGARRAMILPVSVPSHCGLMKSAADALEPALLEAEIRSPSLPVYQNVDARARKAPNEIRAALAAQIWQPVLWTTTIQRFATMGVSRVAECGPGRVLAGLNRRISRDLESSALTDSEAIQNTIAQWSNS